MSADVTLTTIPVDCDVPDKAQLWQEIRSCFTSYMCTRVLLSGMFSTDTLWQASKRKLDYI